MTERISLVEAYDNRDVIAQLVRLRDNVDELLNILKDIDPNGDLTNVVTKTGDQTIDGVKTFIGQIVADCDIIQNGAAYETHAEQVYSVNDLIVTRDGQITGLAPGGMSGFHVKKYNGVDDSRLGVDNTGTMRVGDVGYEQPLVTRDEAADMVSGALVKWDGVNQKIIAPASNVGSDSLPVKVVNGELVPVANSLVVQFESVSSGIPEIRIMKYGKVVTLTVTQYNATAGETTLNIPNLPKTYGYEGSALVTAQNAHGGGIFIANGNTTEVKIVNSTGTTQAVWGTFVYITQD